MTTVLDGRALGQVVREDVTAEMSSELRPKSTGASTQHLGKEHLRSSRCKALKQERRGILKEKAEAEAGRGQEVVPDKGSGFTPKASWETGTLLLTSAGMALRAGEPAGTDVKISPGAGPPLAPFPSRLLPLLGRASPSPYSSPSLGFGISTKFWDYIFHTLMPEEPHPKIQ